MADSDGEADIDTTKLDWFNIKGDNQYIDPIYIN